MGKILIIEPQRMLQHALVAALAPEYEILLAAAPGKMSGEFDAQIVDVAALRAAGAWNEQAMTALRNAQLPTVLIENAEPVEMSAHCGLVRLRAPLSRDALRNAMRECLGGAETTATEKKRPKRARPAAPKKADAEPPAPTAADPTGVIELTEVVEED